MQPAIGNGFGGFLRVLVIAQHQARAAQEDFAILGDAQFITRHRPAHGAETYLPRPVETAIGQVLGHAVALANGDADALIPVEQGTWNRRRAADQNACTIQAQALANLARHQATNQRNTQQPRQLGLRQFLQHALLKTRP